VWFVRTLDEAGQPSVGSAFVAFSDSSQSFLLASFTTVRAATGEPGPDVVVRKGDDEMRAELTAWDPANDLALLTVDRPNLPALTWAPPTPRRPPATGSSWCRAWVGEVAPSARASWPACPPRGSSTTRRWARPSRAGPCWTPRPG
jgi:S1-C subfamily serine protease